MGNKSTCDNSRSLPYTEEQKSSGSGTLRKSPKEKKMNTLPPAL